MIINKSQRIKDLESEVRCLKADNETRRQDYWNLLNKIQVVVEHLGLEFQTEPSRTVLIKKDSE